MGQEFIDCFQKEHRQRQQQEQQQQRQQQQQEQQQRQQQKYESLGRAPSLVSHIIM